MTKSIIIGSMALLSMVTIPALARSRIVFMEESATGKQIVAVDDDGTHRSLLTRNNNEWHLYPDLTGDGKLLSYCEGPASSGGADLSIVTQDVSGTVKEIWTPARGMNIHPRLSGNGAFLAFSGPVGPGGSTRIALIDLAAERQRGPQHASVEDGVTLNTYDPQIKIVPATRPSFFPAPSADGHFIVFQSNNADGSKDILKYDFETEKTDEVVAHDGVNMSPSLSFDDRYVAYTHSFEDGNWDVVIFDLWTHQKHRVALGPSHDLSPSFLFDGSLVFSSDRSGHFELYKIAQQSLYKASPDVITLVSGENSLYAAQASGDLSIEQAALAAFPDPARSSFGTARVGNQVCIVGGHQGAEHTYPQSSFLDSLQCYDINTKIWKTAAPRPIAAHGYQTVAYGKYIYAFGGFTFSSEHSPQWKSIDAIDRYDVENDSWTRIATLPRARSSNAAIEFDGKVYLIGGWDSTPKFPDDLDGRFLREIDVFDLANETTSTARFSLPDPLRRAFSAVRVGNEIVLVGGLGQGASHFELINNVTALDPLKGSWRDLTPLPFATFAPATGSLNGALYVFGGMFKTGEMDYRYVNHIFKLDSKNAVAWTHTGRYLSENKGFSQVVELAPNALGILGGHTYHEDGTDSPVRTFESFAIGF